MRQCELPDDIPAHQYVVAIEAALLVPEAGASSAEEPKEQIPLPVHRIRSAPIGPRSGHARAGVAASSSILGRDLILNSPITGGQYFQLTEVNDGSITAENVNKVLTLVPRDHQSQVETSAN